MVDLFNNEWDIPDEYTSQEDILEEYEEAINFPPMSEGERRLSMAEFFRDVIQSDLVGTSNPNPEVHEIATKVEEEVKDFARRRLSELLGMSAPAEQVSSQFSDEEVMFLKNFADQLKRRAELQAVAEGKTVKSRQKPVSKPKTQRKVVSKPQVKPKPKPRSTIKKQEPQPKRKPGRPKGQPPKNGEILKRGNRTLKVKYLELPERPPAGTKNIIAENGRYFRVIYQELTQQAIDHNPHRIPMPSSSTEMEAATAALSSRAANAMSGDLVSISNISRTI